MSSCNGGCRKPGSGQFAGTDPCKIQYASRKAQELAGGQEDSIGYQTQNGQAVPYITNRINVESMIPVIPILAGAQQLIGGSYAKQAEAGTVTKPKTIFGKALGGVTGRTAAYKAQEAAKSDAPLDSAVAKNLRSQGVPVSGNVAFGNSGDQTLKVLGIFGAVVVSIFYFNRNKRRRRRY